MNIANTSPFSKNAPTGSAKQAEYLNNIAFHWNRTRGTLKVPGENSKERVII